MSPSDRTKLVKETEYAVIGGGLVGMAIAYGLLMRGREVTVFDEGDDAFRASRGNFGLIWVQHKGYGLPDYTRWTRLSASIWPQLRDQLTGASGLDLHLKQPGGLDLFLSDEEAEKGVAVLETIRRDLGEDYPYEYLDHKQVKKLQPEIGDSVVGGTWFPEDGHVNPLFLLQAFHYVFNQLGGKLVNGASVTEIVPKQSGFQIKAQSDYHADKVVLSAGLGNAKLAPMLGLNAPVSPNRGHILVTERMQPFLKYPTVQIRQVGEGAIQIGDSKEDVGLDSSTSPEVLAKIANRARKLFPLLESARIVRSWAALRIMSSDGFPIYDQSETCPGASVVTCHSGVTLAASHALILAGWLDSGEGPDFMESFSAKRFTGQHGASSQTESNAGH